MAVELSLAPSSLLSPGPCGDWVSVPNKEHSSGTSVSHVAITILWSFAPCPPQRFELFGTFGGLYSSDLAFQSLSAPFPLKTGVFWGGKLVFSNLTSNDALESSLPQWEEKKRKEIKLHHA